MKRHFMKLTALLLVLAFIMTGVLGCNKQVSDKKTPAVSQEKEYKTVVDQNGRTVKIPTKIERVVVTSILPLAAVYFLANGSCSKLVGVHPACKSAAENSMLKILAPEIMQAESDFIKGEDLNIEELMKLKPDVVFYRGNNEKELKLLEAAGIPAIAVQPMARPDGNTVEILNSWVKLVGEVMKLETRADEIINYGREVEKSITNKTANLTEQEKPRALIIYRLDEKKIEVAGSNFFGNYWLRTTGAQDVAEDIKMLGQVNMEQIYKWNPEIIYITNFTPTLAEDLLKNTIKGQDWSKVAAVQKGQVYKIPLGIYRWFPPSGDTPLMLKWMAQKNQPKLFSEYSIEKEIKQYYTKFYNYNLSDQQVQMILNPTRDSAKDAQ
ncbi:MAG: ABC transporter substrate-binding protein [Syntrophomonadaceae bacterium]|nr:ABC transporter substrate-binding protein [Syntrophomonadaceae bacterium]